MLSFLVLCSLGITAGPVLQAQNSTSSAASQASPAATSSQALPDDPGAAAHLPSGPTAVFDTSMGRITCGLFSKEAPNTVANFIGLATGTKDWTDPSSGKKMHHKPLYNGTTFHRVIPDFMIQGGDPLGTGMGGPGYKFADEVTPDLGFDVPGRLAMANAGPNTNGSQFFITVAPVTYLDGHYSIFGQCDAAGVLVAQSITQVPRNRNNKPEEPVVLEKVTIVQPGQPLPPVPGAKAPAAHP
jgi:peptidyl-prolyl cis-trans isomerase A (cyclophilin A)